MDLITGLPMQRGYNAILTIVDHGCSRAAVFLPCADTITGPGIAQLYLDHVYQWFGLPSRMISDRDPRFTSHFGKVLTTKLGVSQNLSTAFHPQTDGLSEQKNQWVEQYLCLVTSMDPKGWIHWLALATAVHNNQTNVTTGLSPNQILLGYNPVLNQEKSLGTTNALVETRSELMERNRRNAIWALNKSSDQSGLPPSQYKLGQRVWLDATHLKLPHQKAKLTPKRLGPFRIIEEISPVAYRLTLPVNWRIHNVFHASLLNPYHETKAHGPNFARPPPDLIEGEEEYEVERIVTHRSFGQSKSLQYLIKWKGYPESDNSWEPADQVHALDLVKYYHSAVKGQSAIRSAAHDQSSPLTTPYQSMKEEQSAAIMKEIKGRQPAPRKRIECLMIFPASPSNNSLKTFLSNNSLPLNVPSTISTPLNPVLTASSTSDTSLAPRTSPNTVGTVNSTTAPFTTAIEKCPWAPLMPQTNPPQTVHPLPESLVLVATSPFRTRIYSASPSPSPPPQTKTTPLLEYPDSSAQATPPTLGPP